NAISTLQFTALSNDSTQRANELISRYHIIILLIQHLLQPNTNNNSHRMIYPIPIRALLDVITRVLQLEIPNDKLRTYSGNVLSNISISLILTQFQFDAFKLFAT